MHLDCVLFPGLSSAIRIDDLRQSAGFSQREFCSFQEAFMGCRWLDGDGWGPSRHWGVPPSLPDGRFSHGMCGDLSQPNNNGRYLSVQEAVRFPLIDPQPP